MNRKHLSRVLLLILFLIYWAVSLRHLTIVPPVYEDEPWQASTGWKIATEGVFGSDVFRGFYGMEAHYYGYMPVHPFLLAAVFKVGGLGLFQARFEPVVLGLLILALTYALGKGLFRPSIGLLAVFLLLFSRTSGLTPSQYTGIVFMDITRIGRYDTAVPLFGLAAFLLYTAGLNTKLKVGTNELRFVHFAGIGFLTSLATLSHLYGLFWFAAFFLLFLWHKRKWYQIAVFVAAFSLPWLLYLGYVLPHWRDWVGQTQDYAPRFELFNLSWYWQNLTNEVSRYGAGLGVGSSVRPGLWTAIVILPLSFIALGRRALQGSKQAQALIVPALVIPALFALLIYLKLSNYLITIAPLFALLMAWGVLEFLQNGKRSSTWLRLAIMALLLVITLEGFSRFVRLEQEAQTTTPYSEFSAEIQRHIPAEGRILALHTYWFDFQSWDFRSWFVPLLQHNPDYWQPPLSIETALDGVDPTIIFIDHRMRDLFAGDPETAEAVFGWMGVNDFEQTAVVEDETYGRMDIYLRAGDE